MEYTLPPASSTTFSQPTATARAKALLLDPTEFIAIKQDLIKTMILAAIAIGFEIAVYIKFGTKF